MPAIVIVHDIKTGKDYELTPAGDDLYRAWLVVDKEFAKNEHRLCIPVYAQNPDKFGRSKKAEDTLRGLGMCDVNKPHAFDPTVSLTRNRAEVSLNVVEAGK